MCVCVWGGGMCMWVGGTHEEVVDWVESGLALLCASACMYITSNKLAVSTETHTLTRGQHRDTHIKTQSARRHTH